MKTKCINGALGIEICDVDLNKINNETKSDILELYNENLVLLFRGQDLNPDAQVAFSEIFGPVNAHPLKTRASVKGLP